MVFFCVGFFFVLFFAFYLFFFIYLFFFSFLSFFPFSGFVFPYKNRPQSQQRVRKSAALGTKLQKSKAGGGPRPQQCHGWEGGEWGDTKPHPSVCPSPHSHCNGSTARGRLWGRWELTAHTEQSQVAEGPQQHPSIPSPRRRTVCNPAEQGQGAITLHGKP